MQKATQNMAGGKHGKHGTGPLCRLKLASIASQHGVAAVAQHF